MGKNLEDFTDTQIFQNYFLTIQEVCMSIPNFRVLIFELTVISKYVDTRNINQLLANGFKWNIETSKLHMVFLEISEFLLGGKY